MQWLHDKKGREKEALISIRNAFFLLLLVLIDGKNLNAKFVYFRNNSHINGVNITHSIFIFRAIIMSRKK